MTKDNEISARDYLPAKLSLPSLQVAAKNCRGCHLYLHATQTVFGEGRKSSPIMMVGEIPGNKEDQIGRPFVGPAGILLRSLINKTNLDDTLIYYTNVVKHFKFTYMNKKKLHRSPIATEIKACRPWLEAEIAIVQPKVILCLGLNAAKALISKTFKLKEQRGKWFTLTNNIAIIASFHPSAILRTINRDDKQKMQALLSKDLNVVADFISRN